MRMAMASVGLFLAAALAWAVVAQRNAAPGGPTDARTAPDLTTPAAFDGLRQVTKGQKLLWGLDAQQRGMRAYRIQATDTKVLVDAQGRIAFTSVGPTDHQRLRAEVARALP